MSRDRPELSPETGHSSAHSESSRSGARFLPSGSHLSSKGGVGAHLAPCRRDGVASLAWEDAHRFCWSDDRRMDRYTAGHRCLFS